MKPDYASAATRHLIDAEMLNAAHRPDNAHYLAGYVVECSLKAVVALASIHPERLLRTPGVAGRIALSDGPRCHTEGDG